MLELLRYVVRYSLPLVLLWASNAPAQTREESFTFGRFGTVHVYRQSDRPAHVVLFVSGDGGWNLGVVDMARQLASSSALVVGVDITHYLRTIEASSEACSYPAADFEALSKFVQKKLEYPVYVTPILIGYSSGATLVYATLVQSPPNTFRGAMSLGFCPDLPLTKPMCRGQGLTWATGPKGKGYSFSPAPSLEVPWIALQGEQDQVCRPQATARFVAQVPQGELVSLPKVGHGYAVPRNWMPQFQQAFSRLVSPRIPERPPVAEAVAGLPLEETAAGSSSRDAMAFILSGDGGWGVTERGISAGLAARGIPSVGLNTLHYFWTQRTPQSSTQDLERVLRHYLSLWNKSRVVLIGYSFGADVLPFLVNRLPADLRSRVELLVLLGPSHHADFEFHLSDWLGGGRDPDSLAVRPELEKLRGLHMLCFYGAQEGDDVLCPELDKGLARVIELEGGHRLGANYQPVMSAILESLP